MSYEEVLFNTSTLLITNSLTCRQVRNRMGLKRGGSSQGLFLRNAVCRIQGRHSL